jgi:thioredoxin reductase
MSLPVVVVGAGPVGLATAAHARRRGLDVVVLERGEAAGAAVTDWGHVRLFSSWSELVDPVAAELLARSGWSAPDPAAFPTGGQWVQEYLAPLAAALVGDGAQVRYGHRVTGVARRGRDVLVDEGRTTEPFDVHVEADGGHLVVEAAAVVDASGTWLGPNPLGADGYRLPGERTHAARITYGIPDLDDPTVAARYAGRHVAVAGAGASAQNVLVALARLAEREPATRVSWLVRRGEVAFGGGAADQLEQRGALGLRAERAARSGAVRTLTGFRTTAVDGGGDGTLRLTSADGQVLDGVDEVVVVTGFRPDLSFLSEVRLDLDPVLQAPRTLAPLIDPNHHSCGTVHPHGAAELAQPERGLYLVGMKSYGRATSFLALTGYEQVRSVVAALAGDHEAASRVELVLPETGVCKGSGQPAGLPLVQVGAGGGSCCA